MLRLRTDPDRFAEPAMIGSVSQVFAGHAGEAGFPPAMPHEVLAGMALLAMIGVILVAIGSIVVWLLFKIERHLRNRITPDK